MAIYVGSESNGAETVNSSMDAVTIASSFRSQGVGLAVPAIDIAASDSPLLSEASAVGEEDHRVHRVGWSEALPSGFFFIVGRLGAVGGQGSCG